MTVHLDLWQDNLMAEASNSWHWDTFLRQSSWDDCRANMLTIQGTNVNSPGGVAHMLLFKRKFLDAIRRGEKMQTIRLWKVRRMRAGQRSYIPGIGHIHVTAVDPVDIDALTDRDALLDGFPNAKALQAELRQIYGDKLAEGHQAYRVQFGVENRSG